MTRLRLHASQHDTEPAQFPAVPATPLFSGRSFFRSPPGPGFAQPAPRGGQVNSGRPFVYLRATVLASLLSLFAFSAQAMTFGASTNDVGNTHSASNTATTTASNSSHIAASPAIKAPTTTLPVLLPSGNAKNLPSARPTGDAPEKAVQERREENPAPQVSDEFQRFIAKTTGTSLPLFGSHLFERAPSTFAPVDNTPVTPDYVLGPGDELFIRVWGSVDAELRTLVDRNGQINIPKVGTIGMAGIRAGEAEAYLHTKLGRVFKNFDLNVTLGQLRSIHVYVVGSAKRPGVYSLSGLSTLINALFASGGPANTGSMRHIQLKRGGQVVTELDLYDFIIKGDNSHDLRLQAGDVIVIPPAGPKVAIAGAFNLPAIYELKGKQASVREVIDIGGGLPIVAAQRLAALERIDHTVKTSRKVEEITLDEAGMAHLLQDGDILTVLPISPKFDNAITLKGNVANPMRYPWKTGMRIADLLIDSNALIPLSYWEGQNKGKTSKNYNNKEVNWDYATLQRLDKDKLTTHLIAFNLGKAIRGDSTENLMLEPGDIVTVYGWDDELPATENSIQLSAKFIGGNKRFVWREGMHIQDIIPNAKWLIEYYDYWLNTKNADKRVEINWDYANISRQSLKDLTKSVVPFNLAEALASTQSPHNQPLLPGDEIALFTNAEVQAPLAKRKVYVNLNGEVATPGIYQAQPGETLRQIISRIGGITPQAYIHAAEFYRESTRKLQQEKLDNVLDRLEKSLTLSANKTTQSATSVEEIEATKMQRAYQQQLVARLREVKATGRVVLEVPPQNNSVALLPDIPLEDGDRLLIPATPSAVNIVGEVNNESAFLHKSGKTLSDYLDQAGGVTQDGDESALYVLKADGSTVATHKGWFTGWLRNIDIMPGDTIVVPILAEKKSWTKELKDWTQILYQFGMGVASLKALKNL